MLEPHKREEVEQETQDEPEAEPVFPGASAGDLEADDVGATPAESEPPAPELPLVAGDDEEEAEEEVFMDDEKEQCDFPSLEEYTAKWDRLLAQHSKPNPGPFSRDNLIPEPIYRLWQARPINFAKAMGIPSWRAQSTNIGGLPARSFPFAQI